MKTKLSLGNKQKHRWMHTVSAVISRDGWERQSCGSVPASSTTCREKQNRTIFGNLRKRGQEMGWFRDPERTHGSMRAEDEKGGRHTEIKRETRERGRDSGEWRCIEVTQEESPVTMSKMSPPPATSSILPGTTQAHWGPALALRRCRDSDKVLCGQSCHIFRHILKNPSGEPALNFPATVLRSDDSFTMSTNGRLSKTSSSSRLDKSVIYSVYKNKKGLSILKEPGALCVITLSCFHSVWCWPVWQMIPFCDQH